MRASCGYYVRRTDRLIFALRVFNGRLATAAGPLLPAEMDKPPPAHPATIDASAWRLEEFEALGIPWELARKERLPPGHSQPGGKKTIEETAEGFKIALVPE